MHLALSSAAAWFFVSSSLTLDGTLGVRLVEGIKAQDREFVEAGDTKLGPCSPARVQAANRVAEQMCSRAVLSAVDIRKGKGPGSINGSDA
jgi:hypothetical protein